MHLEEKRKENNGYADKKDTRRKEDSIRLLSRERLIIEKNNKDDKLCLVACGISIPKAAISLEKIKQYNSEKKTHCDELRERMKNRR